MPSRAQARCNRVRCRLVANACLPALLDDITTVHDDVALLVGIALRMTAGVDGLVAGTAAMFLVGGGIISHRWPWLHHASEALARRAGAALGWLSVLLFDAAVGVATGTLLLAAWMPGRKLLGRGAA